VLLLHKQAIIHSVQHNNFGGISPPGNQLTKNKSPYLKFPQPYKTKNSYIVSGETKE